MIAFSPVCKLPNPFLPMPGKLECACSSAENPLLFLPFGRSSLGSFSSSPGTAVPGAGVAAPSLPSHLGSAGAGVGGSPRGGLQAGAWGGGEGTGPWAEPSEPRCCGDALAVPPTRPWRVPGTAPVFLAPSLVSEGTRNISRTGRCGGRRGPIRCRLARQRRGSGRRSPESREPGSAAPAAQV